MSARPGETAGAPFRLAAYSDTQQLGGADLSLSHLLRLLDPEIEVTVFGVNGAVVDRIAAGRPATRTAVVPAPRSDHDWQSLAAHLSFLRTCRPDILHVSLASPWSCQYAIAAAALARRPRVVAVYQLPVPPVSRRQWLAKRLTSRVVSRHVGVGVRTSREVEELVGLRTGSVATIHNGVPDLSFEPRPKSSTPVVGSVGRLALQKGFDLLLHALTDIDGATLVLVGDGEERAKLKAIARDLGVGERVVWTGWDDDPRSLIRSFDVFALPSRFEGFPLVVLEALLAETAVVATDVGSVPEAVRHGETGLLVPPEDVGALSTAIRQLLDDQALRTRLGAAGRRLVLSRFTDEHMARSFRALYDGLLE